MLEHCEASHLPNMPTLSGPRVIGLYGIPGCGKSFLLNKLKNDLEESEFEYFEGSEEIDSVTPGGLDAFKKLGTVQQTHFRQLAIDSIKSKCIKSGKVGVVTGHFIFWSNENEAALRVCTDNDLSTYTHIIYVNTPVEATAKQRLQDRERIRSDLSIEHLRRWQDTEVEELRELCRQHGILFTTVYPIIEDKLSKLLLDFQAHGEEYNNSIAKQHLEYALSTHYDELQTVLFLDGDKTLTAQDTGEVFWEKLSPSKVNPVRTLFSSQLGYSYIAFRQAMLLYEESTDDAEFDTICTEVSLQTPLYSQMFSLLHRLGSHNHIRLVIVTCGLRRVWEKIIEREGLSETVKIMGGGRLADGFVVTPSVKAYLVSCTKQIHAAYTWAFGDSPLDLPMLAVADQAIVVVGEERSRSKSMGIHLLAALVNDGLQARQALLPNSSVSPRLDTIMLPIVDLISPEFVDSIIKHHIPPGGLQLRDATDSSAAKLLMTPMRDADIRGPALRDAHSKAGSYLAWRFLADLIGLEEVIIRHVQGNNTIGHRLRGEEKTLIVALMRGGESMALGINEVFPKAQFLHAKEPKDIKRHHLEDNVTVILVDSVINNGNTVVKFVESIRAIHAMIRIFVVAGVVQDKAVSGCGPLKALARTAELTVVALRLSKNKYTGSGGTDTGNRLFNTAYLL